MATSGLVRWDHLCPPRHDGIIHAVIARIPQCPKRSLGPLARGWQHGVSVRRQRPRRWPRRAWSGGITCALLAMTEIQPAVIARIPQCPKRSLAPLARGSQHDIPPTQSAPPVGAGRFAERASAYWITKRWMKVWSPAVTFTRYMPWAMEASRAITVFRVLPFTAMVRVVTL